MTQMKKTNVTDSVISILNLFEFLMYIFQDSKCQTNIILQLIG